MTEQRVLHTRPVPGSVGAAVGGSAWLGCGRAGLMVWQKGGRFTWLSRAVAARSYGGLEWAVCFGKQLGRAVAKPWRGENNAVWLRGA